VAPSPPVDTEDSDDPTADNYVAPWHSDQRYIPADVRFVVAWWLDEPERVGQSFVVDDARVLGRSRSSSSALLAFHRPFSAPVPAAHPRTQTLSRHHLEFLPEEPGAIRVLNVGRRALRHNGAVTTDCLVRPGDVLYIEDVAVLVADTWPRAFDPGAAAVLDTRFPFGTPDGDGIVGETAAAWQLRIELARLAARGRHALVLGETGVGKELAARALHQRSPRARGPFVARNASTFTETLIAAELFGSARGFPDPRSPERLGLIGMADGGTLFLDELGELPETMQARLLRVLDSGGDYQRLGKDAIRTSAFCFVGATNRDPDTLKNDLGARLPAHPLNTRGLLQLLLLSAESSPEGYLRLTPAVSEAVGLQGPPREAPAAISAEDPAFRRQIERAIEEHGTVKGAAEHLGMDRFKLSRTMGRLGIPKPARP
jgi:hypothetical protein